VPTEDEFTPDQPLPLFLAGHERGSLLLLNVIILVITAILVGMAISLSLGNPLKVYADIKASPTAISTLQPDTAQPTLAIQSTTDSQALPPTARVASTRDEIPATFDSADRGQGENSAAPPGALLNQFQTWATKENARAQIEPDAQAQVLQSAQIPVPSIQKHRTPIQNARAEIRHPRAAAQQAASIPQPKPPQPKAHSSAVQSSSVPRPPPPAGPQLSR
jgi:hypothetical protein